MRPHALPRTFAVIAVLAGTVFAEFSPLSTHPEGFGMPIAQMGSRERGMGEGAMAGVSTNGFYPLNVSRSAFHEKTVFLATLENDVDWLRDDASSTRMNTGAFPTLATLIKTKNFGTFGAFYQQSYMRNFEARFPRSGDTAGGAYVAEGGVYVLGASWAYAPLSWLALGFSQNLVLSRDRFIRSADFTTLDDAPPEAEPFRGDTLEVSGSGLYPALSLTLRTEKLDFALSYTHSVDLETKRTHRASGVTFDSLSDTTARLPRVFAAGVAWKFAERQTAVFDGFYENWVDAGLINPAWQLSTGYERLGSENPFDGLWKRTAWRAGAGYKMLYLRDVPEVFATAGFGMPLGLRGHQLDFAVKYGHRSFDGNTFFAEDYVKLSASVVGVSVWGQPVRKRR